MATYTYCATRIDDGISKEERVSVTDLLMPQIRVEYEYVSTTSGAILRTEVHQFTPPTSISCQSFFSLEGEYYLYTHLSHFPHFGYELLQPILPRLQYMVQRAFAITDDDLKTFTMTNESNHSNMEPPHVAHRCFSLNFEFSIYINGEGHMLADNMPDGRMLPASENGMYMILRKPKTVEWEQDCIICMEHFDDDGGGSLEEGLLACAMPCDHVFHQKCIVQWLRTSHLCPLCRYPMPTTGGEDFSLWVDLTIYDEDFEDNQ